MKLSLTATLSFALALFVSAPAEAASIAFSLNCDISGPAPCTAMPAAGTIELTDNTTNTNWVDIVVTVTSGKIKDFYLNIAGTPSPGFSFLTTGPSVGFSPNGKSADGYDSDFDLVIPNNGNINEGSLSTTLQL